MNQPTTPIAAPRLGKAIRSGTSLLAVIALVGACGDDDDADSAAQDGASVSFVTPGDGDSIAGGVEFELAAEGVAIEPAGEVREGAGHFHVVADAGCVERGDAIPRDADHVHLGQGQFDGVVYLEPGRHELCAQVGDGAHTARELTDTVTVEIGIDDQDQWCAVVEQLDGLLDDPALEDEDDLAILRPVAENARRLIVQLSSGIDHVDPEHQDAVAGEVDLVLAFVTAFIDAETIDEAYASLDDQQGESGNESDGEASAWILDTCAVDIDD